MAKESDVKPDPVSAPAGFAQTQQTPSKQEARPPRFDHVRRSGKKASRGGGKKKAGKKR